MRKLTFFFAAMCMMVFQYTIAQDTLRLTLPQALEIALSESPTIKVADMEIERVDYSKKSAWYAIIPNLEASAQHSQFLIPAKMSMMGQLMDSPTSFNTNMSATLSLPLFAPALWKNIEMTSLDMQLAHEKAKASRETLRQEVSKAYYTVLVVQDSYKVLQDGYELTKKNVELAKKGYEVGTLAAYDYISAEVQMNNMLPNLMQAENGINQAKAYLKILMGLDVTMPIKVLNTLTDFEGNIKEVNSLDEITLENNTDLKQMEIGHQQLLKGLELQRTQRMPTLAAFGQYGYAGMGTKETTLNFGGMPIQVEARKDWYPQGLIVGLQLRVPITGIFTGITKEKQMRVQEQMLLTQRDQAENALKLQAKTALDNMNKAVQQVKAAENSVKLSEKAYDISSKRYENGAGTMLELQNASLAITQAKLSYHQAISEYLNAKADLEKVIGKEI